MTPDDTPRDAGEDTRERTEHIARVLHDAATGRITPDPADPTPYGRMAARVHDEVVAPLVERLRQAQDALVNARAKNADNIADREKLLRDVMAERDEARQRADKRLVKYVEMADRYDAERSRVADLGQRAVILPEDWRGQIVRFSEAHYLNVDTEDGIREMISRWGVAAQPAEPTQRWGFARDVDMEPEPHGVDEEAEREYPDAEAAAPPVPQAETTAHGDD